MDKEEMIEACKKAIELLNDFELQAVTDYVKHLTEEKGKE